MSDKFTCEACGETFDKEWSDEEVEAEREAVFGGKHESDDAVVCDDCWIKMGFGEPVRR